MVRARTMVDHFHSTTFSECLHTPFQIHVAGVEPLSVELIEVSEKNTSPRLEEFALYFRGPAAPYASQALHHMEHEKLGKFDVFLVPIGPDKQGMVYEAIF